VLAPLALFGVYFSIYKLKHWTFNFIPPYTWYKDQETCTIYVQTIYLRHKYTVYTMDINQRENARCMYMFKYKWLSDSVIKKGQQQQKQQQQAHM